MRSIVLVLAFVLAFTVTRADYSCATGLEWCDTVSQCVTTGECPNLNTCPSDKPYLCLNGSCALTPAHCCADYEDGASIVYCWDGSCVLPTKQCPKLECPDTAKPYSCPELGVCVSCPDECPDHYCPSSLSVACWDSNCVSDYDDCPCPDQAMYRCDDGAPDAYLPGQCRYDVEECPRTNGCPNDKPVRCDDGSCKKSGQCITPETCASGVRCSDGVCRESTAECANYLSNGCPTSEPYLCEVGICVEDHTECPIPWQCRDPEKPYRCTNGLCVADGSSCPVMPDPLNQCFSEKLPVMCADGSCVEHYLMCPATMSSECGTAPSGNQSTDCPDHLPYYCYEGDLYGMCVEDSADCEMVGNCTARFPYRCDNGFCVEDESQCAAEAETQLCNQCTTSKPKKCPNGACYATDDPCPLLNGCYEDTPYFCPDGTCHQLLSDCTNLTESCPDSLPIRCSKGNCVAERLDCRTDNFTNPCEQAQKILCASGSCVDSIEYCDVVIVCENDTWSLCADGTQVTNLSDCSTVWNCPTDTPYHCGSKVCAANASACSSAGCPTSSPILCWDGGCYADSTDCPSRYWGGWYGGGYGNDSSNATYTSGDWDVYYQTGDVDLNETITGEDGQYADLEYHIGGGGWLNGTDGPYGSGWGGRGDGGVGACRGDTPFNCFDGTCATTPYECYSAYNETCDDITCADGSCVTSTDECDAVQACPVLRPKRCSDGTCIITEAACEEVEECETNTTRCEDGVCREDCLAYNGCPLSHPVSCDDGSCSEDGESCYEECLNGLTRCFNGTCVELIGYCNHTNPASVKLSCFVVSRNVSTAVETSVLSAYDSNVTLGEVRIPAESFITDLGVAPAFEICGLTDSAIRNITGSTANIVTPVLRVEPQTEIDEVNSPLTIKLEAVSGLTESLSSYCLALATTEGSSNETGFVCVDDSVISMEDDYLVATSSETGIFAFITVESSGASCSGDFPLTCDNGTCVASSYDCYETLTPSDDGGDTDGAATLQFKWLLAILLMALAVLN